MNKLYYFLIFIYYVKSFVFYNNKIKKNILFTNNLNDINDNSRDKQVLNITAIREYIKYKLNENNSTNTKIQ